MPTPRALSYRLNGEIRYEGAYRLGATDDRLVAVRFLEETLTLLRDAGVPARSIDVEIELAAAPYTVLITALVARTQGETLGWTLVDDEAV